MIHKPKNVEEIKSLLKKHKPKVVVFAGRHEPLEPSSRFLEKEHNGSKIHERYSDPTKTLIIKLPPSFQPRITNMKAYDRLYKGFKEIKKGGGTIGKLSEEDSQKLASAFLDVTSSEHFSEERYRQERHIPPGFIFRQRLDAHFPQANDNKKKQLKREMLDHISNNVVFDEKAPSDWTLHDVVRKISPGTKQIDLHFGDSSKATTLHDNPEHITLELAGLEHYRDSGLLTKPLKKQTKRANRASILSDIVWHLQAEPEKRPDNLRHDGDIYAFTTPWLKVAKHLPKNAEYFHNVVKDMGGS